MALAQDRCICLRKTEYSETSQILSLFSRTHGVVRLIAKGAHRRTKAGASKFGGGVDYLDVGQALFGNDPAKELSFLGEWTLLEGNLAIRKTLRGMFLGLFAAEMVDRLIEAHDPHPDLFDRLEATLAPLATPRREEAFLAFELDLLREAGILPELFACITCDRPQAGDRPVAFAPGEGGIVCRDCADATPDRMELDPRLLRLLQSLVAPTGVNGVAPRLPQLTRHQTDPINRLLSLHVERTLGRRLRMPKWVLAR